MRLQGKTALVTGSTKGIGLAYCVCKAGVNMLTKVLAIEWAAQRVRVNAIAPGYIETEMVVSLPEQGKVDEASYITGTVLTVDGGRMAYGYV